LGNAIRNRVQIPLRQSLLRFLENESQRQGSSIILLTCSKKMLADTFGVARTSLSRMLQQLKDEGLLDFDRNTITLHAPSKDLN
jgi:CRP-like cAMP-binding protein